MLPLRGLIVTVLLGLVASSCSQAGVVLGQKPVDLTVPNGIDVGFNHRAVSRYRSPLSGAWRNGDNLEQMLINAIQSAEKEILVAVQELSLPRIAESLVAASRQGVNVKVILENNYSTPWSQQHELDLSRHGRKRLQRLKVEADQDQNGVVSPEEERKSDALLILQNGQIAWIDDTEDGSKGSGLMHHKFVVIDGERVITGSANFTNSGIHGDAGATQTRGNVNHLINIQSPALASIFKEEFAQMWGDGPGGSKNSRFGRNKTAQPLRTVKVGSMNVSVLFPPHAKTHSGHGLDLIEDQLGRAKKTIDLALFVFSAQQLTNKLAERISAGVKLRLLADPGFASRSFSEVLDLLGVALPDRFCKLEAGNQPLTKPLKGIGTSRLAHGDKLHHKFAVIDNKTVITGSFNWSPSAAHTNDETLLVIESPQLAAHFTREMDRMWRGAELGITARMQRKLDRQTRKCGSGVQRKETSTSTGAKG
ncbi:phosphatidylserine/phosphatidylglycerophosphate/cardiolipin synthase family protein [bacterium]|nr:phosphatidylserine/phosphatidylglycerophosphate/cardiolipin synthase family protein [bacterium]